MDVRKKERLNQPLDRALMKIKLQNQPQIYLPEGAKLIADARALHSLVETEKRNLTAEEKKSKMIMAVEHVSRPLFGIQFHPESVGTKTGKQILKNFLSV